MKNSVLFLDLGTTCGWALACQGRIISGSYSLQSSRWTGGGMRYLRFRREFLNRFIQVKDPVREVWFEEVHRHAGTDAAHIFGGLLATLTAWCEEHSIPYQGVGVGVWKKAVCGKGNADKEAVLASMKARGYNPGGYDESDALAGLHYVLTHKTPKD